MSTVGLIMGSDSDWVVMSAAAEALAEFEVPYEVGVVSAHRTPQKMLAYAESAADRGLQVIIAGAGGAAHLPGMVASATTLPVIVASSSAEPSLNTLSVARETWERFVTLASYPEVA